MKRSLYAAPRLSMRWLAVWRRNCLVWKKLAAESARGNIIEPLFYGVFHPLANMPPWLQMIAKALPLTHAIELGRSCFANAC